MRAKIRIIDLILYLCRYNAFDVVEIGPGEQGHLEILLPLRAPEPKQSPTTLTPQDHELMKEMRIKL